MDKDFVRQIVKGSLIVTVFFVLLCLVAVFSYLPGFLGEWSKALLAILTNPVLMAVSLFFLGLTFVFLINGIRRNREGNDYVRLDAEGKPQLDEDGVALEDEQLNADKE
ncbi:hypothetical protein [Persicirhabdus sediminis]|uniref:Uncharacterized protein n=1 Tax=Persicirhabdus sediminis TaxID=454144 RepID=A0A8J7MFU6_9BACT|nr:hypothetical protein [Persicirhabdus sediminis]MBK1792001.1 hypothetical protein [Persicirhabdus sediminis]